MSNYQLLKASSISYKTRKNIMELGVALLFILPSFILFISFVFIPIVRTMGISFFKWDGIQPTMDFVGLKNYSSVLAEPPFHKSLINNGIWGVMHIIFACGTGLFLAFLITRARYGRNFFRTVLFLPNVIALSVSAVIWAMIFNPEFGVVNTLLRGIGLGGAARAWLGDSTFAIYAISLASSWQAYGYYMILFIAGLQNIDITLYEAARIDGANSLQQFWHVTIPGLRNVLTFVLSISIINGLKGFATVWTMTQGGPGYATYLLTLYVFRKAFVEYDFGHAATGGVILGLIVIIITVAFNRLRDKKDL